MKINRINNIESLFLLIVCLGFFPEFSRATPILDQEVIGNTDIGIVIPGAQSFTVSNDGYLTNLEVELGGRRGETRSYGIGITRSNFGGTPIDDYESNYLFYESGELFDQNRNTWINFELPEISVSEGEKLFIYFINTGQIGNFSNGAFVYQDENSDQYIGGELWVNDGNWRLFRDYGADVSFRTYITTIPEPHTIMLFVTGLLAVRIFRRRNFRHNI